MYRDNVRPSKATLPSICPKADPKPPVELRPDGGMLAEIEARYRSLGLINDGQSIHWVGHQLSNATTCTCDLSASSDTPPASEQQKVDAAAGRRTEGTATPTGGNSMEGGIGDSEGKARQGNC